MTVSEMIKADLPEIAPSDKHIIAAVLEWLAERLPDARLQNGKRVIDNSDCQQLLHEVAKEVRK